MEYNRALEKRAMFFMTEKCPELELIVEQTMKDKKLDRKQAEDLEKFNYCPRCQYQNQCLY